jgi:hypothetical protein
LKSKHHPSLNGISKQYHIAVRVSELNYATIWIFVAVALLLLVLKVSGSVFGQFYRAMSILATERRWAGKSSGSE